ncbi:MAG: CPBP family intramembrane metalloprotease [Candidatus Caenarcaniphilales bacterium]|nr:CPBP family intramembrane metalloprotease [Candidatus Caenarcaniphilales bacterium]
MSGSKQALMGFAILTISLIFSLLLCIGSIFLYGYLFFDNSLFSSSEVATLLNSPSTLAFQNLLSNIAYAISIIVIIYIFRSNYQKTLSTGFCKIDDFLISTLIILSASILIDQLLLLLTEGHFNFLAHKNLAGNLNIASILGNIDATGLLSFNLLLLLTIFVSPILEELFFRGFLWSSFRKNNSFIKTLIYSSFLFGLIHFDFIQGISAFIISLFYGFIIEKTKSIWPCILAHISASYMTFFLSNNGYTFGVGGNTYPLWLVSLSILSLSLCIFLMNKKKTQP